jgi:PKD repeat protein
VPLLVSDCETGCHSLNDTLFSGFSALDSALINNCNETGSIDFVIGNPALAPIYGGILNSNNLSHLQPICNDDSVKYVMQRTISDLIPDNQRRSFTKSETEIFCKLGYKWGECDECYFSSHSELIEYSENMPSDPIFYACVDDTVVVPFRELLCNDYTNGTYPEITFWEESAGVTVIKGDSVFYVISNFKGTHEVYYRVAGCDCHVLNSIFYVNYISCFDCSSIDPCVNLTCVNGFEQFSTETGSIVAHLELSDGPYWVYENTDKNSVDICTSADQNTYINLGGFIKNIEGLCLKLSEPILPGCKVKVNLDAASNNQSAEMRIHMSKHPPCNFTDTRISIECLQTNCGDYTFTPICVDTIKISNAQTQEGGLCSPYPNLQPIETFYWKNSTQDTLHYIIFSPTINERSIRLDDIIVQQLCLDPDFSFDYLEQCNEVIFTSIDTNSTNSHFWYFGDDSTSTLMHPTHLFEKSDTFLVTHILTDYCGNADTSMLNVIINDEVTECCPDTTLSVGTTWTPSTVLPGDGRFHIITLEQGVSLSIEDGLVLEFCEGGALVIESGAYASLDGTLTSYGDMTWQGVFVEGDTSKGQHINLGNGGFHGLQKGLIHTREGSMIKNAKIGIRKYGLDGDASTGGMIRCEETSFINNTIGVDFGPYQNYSTDGIPKSSLGTFRNCTFNTDTTYHLHEPFNAFVKMRKADGMRFAGCSFTNEILPELPSEVSEFGFGIHSVSSGFMVYAGNSTAATPICPHPCVVGDSTTFKGLGHGIYVLTQDKTQPYSVYHAQFENCFRGITSVGSTGGTMLFNTFRMGEVPDTDFSYGQIGVELHFNHEGFELQENIFDRIEGGSNLNTIGILVNTLGGNDNVIRRNTFRGIESANQAFGVNADLTPDIQRGLIYLCNNIDTTLSQGYDFHIPNTPALDVIHPFQTPGAPNGQEISAGNHFAYTALDFMNYSQDTINYFFNPSVS